MRPEAILTAIMAVLMGLPLAGCGVEDDLGQCTADSEQTVLLRQLAMTDNQRKALSFCQDDMHLGVDYCRSVYLNANTPVRECMKRKGYTFKDADSGFGNCMFGRFRDPSCYENTWLLWINRQLQPSPSIR